VSASPNASTNAGDAVSSAQIPVGSPSGERAPVIVRALGWAALGLVLAGAVYLIGVRGEAIVVDLATLAGKVWCF
jgi:hypothetical protein